MIEIIPAVLTDDVHVLEEKIRAVEDVARMVQIDIMDDKFVPFKTVSVLDIAKIEISLKLEIHLMVNNPEQFFDDCHTIEADRVIFHKEAVLSPRKTLEIMGDYVFDKGVAINPESTVDDLLEYEVLFDMFLLLGVNPGKSGQAFIPETVDKVKKVRSLFPHKEISVDGGVDEKNIADLFKAGASSVAIGSGLYGSSNIKKQYERLIAIANE